ncbi:MAG: hypothetical protein M1521_02565 [Thermotogae bacterium]|nr:hypothetical protein [Thermotogota bacterium]
MILECIQKVELRCKILISLIQFEMREMEKKYPGDLKEREIIEFLVSEQRVEANLPNMEEK